MSILRMDFDSFSWQTHRHSIDVVDDSFDLMKAVFEPKSIMTSKAPAEGGLCESRKVMLLWCDDLEPYKELVRFGECNGDVSRAIDHVCGEEDRLIEALC